MESLKLIELGTLSHDTMGAEPTGIADANGLYFSVP
jgi:hypothetical protein